MGYTLSRLGDQRSAKAPRIRPEPSHSDVAHAAPLRILLASLHQKSKTISIQGSGRVMDTRFKMLLPLLLLTLPVVVQAQFNYRLEEHTSELQSLSHLV